MIRREDLRNAVAAVSARDPEIGYALNELMAANRIRLPVDAGEGEGDPCFLFEGERVYVRNVSFFNHGTAPVEERLVLKYGELVEKHALETASGPTEFFAAAKRVRQAGLDFLVRFEIDRAVAGLRKRLKVRSNDKACCLMLESRIDGLVRILSNPDAGFPANVAHAGVLYSVEIDRHVHADFMRFPFSFAALRQAAEMNLEFFHLRFLLDLYAAGASERLFASTARGVLTGMLLLEEKRRLFYTGLEVRYVATINGVPLQSGTVDYPRIRGTGTFLMAGAWLVWKQFHPGAAEIILDAELGAGRFYAGIGFDYRPPYGYVLKKPKGKLLLFIVAMAMAHPRLSERVQLPVAACIGQQIRYLKKSTPADDPKRKVAILVISSCIQGRPNTFLSETAADLLKKYRKKIPESELLIKSLAALDSAEARTTLLQGAGMFLAVCDPVFEQHLEGIFHLESAKRIRTIESILAEDPIADRMIRVTPRAATEEELGWVHTPAYIASVAGTAGARLFSFDPDTQTTAGSYATARLAAGSVFSLIDAVYKEEKPRCGIACIRPPGHHAEPDRAMGFCLFNNAALGAEYLRRRYGAEKVLIADVDIHHGNGTQKIFYASSQVLYFSIHQFPCYPGTGKLGEIGAGEGEGFTVNVPLSKGRGDREYAKILQYLLFPVARAYQPEMIIVSLGFDLYPHDPLGQMNVSEEGYALITCMLKQLAGEVCRGRIIFVLEGGYSLEGIRRCGRRVFQELADIPTLPPDKIERVHSEKAASLPELKKAIEVHRKFWPSLG